MCSSFSDLSELSLPHAQPSPLLLVCSLQRSDQIWTGLRLFPSTASVQIRAHRKRTSVDFVDPSFGIFLLLKHCLWFDRFSFGSRSCILYLSPHPQLDRFSSYGFFATKSIWPRFEWDVSNSTMTSTWMKWSNDSLECTSCQPSCNEVLRSICRYLPDLRGILLDLTDALEGRTAPRIIAEPTKSKPFHLTAPKPRAVPIPKIVR